MLDTNYWKNFFDIAVQKTIVIAGEFPFIFAFLFGLVPALIWLWFWLKEDKHPEPVKILTLSFLGGIVAVFVVLPFQKLIHSQFEHSQFILFLLWAAVEEIAKFAIVYFIALRNKYTDEPVDDIIYLIVSAIGFVTLENSLFLKDLIDQGNFAQAIINGNLRFVGASLLHIMASATIGICLALAFYKSTKEKAWYLFTGLILAIGLHTVFNLFIIKRAEENLFFIFGVVWVGIILILLLFEKVKSIKANS